LRDLGYIEGQNVTIESRFASGQVERLPEIATELAGVLTLEHHNRRTLVELATKNRIPAMWGHRQFVEAGGLMSYAVNSTSSYARPRGT
jgi:hypothetical protein